MRELNQQEIDQVAGGVIPFALIGVGFNLVGRFIMSPAAHHLMRSAGLISGTHQAAKWMDEGRIEKQ